MGCGPAVWFAYAGVAEAVSHDEVEGGAGLAPVLVDGAAAVLEHLLAQVGALLRLLLEQQVSKLHARQIIPAPTHTNTNHKFRHRRRVRKHVGPRDPSFS